MLYILNYLIENKYIDEADTLFFKYCIEVTVFNFFSVISIIIIAMLNNELEIGISFLLTFIAIRTNLGGFHCKTPVKCLMLFPILYSLTGLVKNIITIKLFYYLSFISILLLFLAKPIKNNKEIINDDYNKCKKRLHIALKFIVAINLISFISNIFNSIVIGVDIAVVLSLILYIAKYLEMRD